MCVYIPKYPSLPLLLLLLLLLFPLPHWGCVTSSPCCRRCCDVEVETWKMSSWHLPLMLVWLRRCYYGCTAGVVCCYGYHSRCSLAGSAVLWTDGLFNGGERFCSELRLFSVLYNDDFTFKLMENFFFKWFLSSVSGSCSTTWNLTIRCLWYTGAGLFVWLWRVIYIHLYKRRRFVKSRLWHSWWPGPAVKARVIQWWRWAPHVSVSISVVGLCCIIGTVLLPLWIAQLHMQLSS